jgi:hypothetical protein
VLIVADEPPSGPFTRSRSGVELLADVSSPDAQEDDLRTTRSGKAFGEVQSRRMRLRQEAEEDPDMAAEDDNDEASDEDDEISEGTPMLRILIGHD